MKGMSDCNVMTSLDKQKCKVVYELLNSILSSGKYTTYFGALNDAQELYDHLVNTGVIVEVK